MKKFFYLFFIVAAFLTLSISCSKAEQDTEIDNPSEEKTEPENATTIRFNVSLASEGGKATIASDGKVTWNEGDQVTVYAVGGEGEPPFETVTVSNISTDGTKAEIETELPAGCTYYAAFPKCENATFANDVMTVSEPAADTPQTNSNCQIAVSKAVKIGGGIYSLQFKNVNALIKFNVSSDLANTVKSAELVSQTSGEAVSYTQVSYDFKKQTDPASFAGNMVTSLKRTVVEGDNFIALAPGVSMSDGFCLKLKDKDGKVVKLFFYDSSFTTARNGGSNISDFENRLYTNLSKDETANCYLINKADAIGCKLFCFDATVKGNGKVVSGLNSPHDSKDLSPNTVTKLWSTYNTRNTPEEGNNPPIVTSVTYHKAGYASFEYGRHGNVILAARNSDENIIWSWHLWLPDHNVHEVIHQKTSESTKPMSHMYMLNANLGALYTSFDSYESFARDFGFYYQWGRKDPFVGTSIRNAPIKNIPYCAVKGESQDYIDTRLETDRLTYSIKHPTIFFRAREKEDINTRYPRARDWFGSSSTAPVDLWKKTEKTVYDPCPPGYRVPVAGNDGPFKGFSNTVWDETKDGRSFINIDNETVWFPAAGFLHRCTGRYQTTSGFESFGVNGGYWCANKDDNFGPEYWRNTQSFYCYFDESTCKYVTDVVTSETAYEDGSESANAKGDNNAGRGTGRSVRCVKE